MTSDLPIDEKELDQVLTSEHQAPETVTFSNINEQKLLRKIDLRLIPWFACLYLLSFMDRGNIANAKLYGFEQELRIDDHQYLLALTCFFFPYALFESRKPVSNIFLRRFRPSVYLSTIMLLWGVVMLCHGLIRAGDYGGLIAARCILGLTEAGLYPGIVFYLSSWYKRSEIGIRVAVFFSSSTLAGAFSGLLAAAISNMDGVGSLSGWRWIFILEGLVTVVFGVISFWIIPEFPESAKFLSEEERAYVISRLREDQRFSAAGEKFQKRFIWQSLTDRKSWIAMGLFMGFDGPLYAFSLFLPSIISQVLFIAWLSCYLSKLINCPSICVGLFSLVSCWFRRRFDRQSELYQHVSAFTRVLFDYIWLASLLFSIGIVAYIILIVSKTPALSYFAVFLAASAIYPAIPNSSVWIANNVEGAYKRAVTLGLAIGFGNLNGAVTANIYRASDQPWYRMGHEIVLVYICLGLISTLVLLVSLRKENARRNRGERDEVIAGKENPAQNTRNGVFESEEIARLEKGDNWSGFRYSL